MLPYAALALRVELLNPWTKITTRGAYRAVADPSHRTRVATDPPSDRVRTDIVFGRRTSLAAQTLDDRCEIARDRGYDSTEHERRQDMARSLDSLLMAGESESDAVRTRDP